MSVPSLQRTVADLIEEYQTKHADAEKAIADFKAAFDRLGMSFTVQGCYVEPVANQSYLYPDSLRKNLLKSAWKAVYDRVGVGRILSANDKKSWGKTLAHPPELTMDTAKATFGDYLIRPRFHILRALAECFVDLDPAYKSHCKVKIGVKGLPKRIILNGWGQFASTYARDKFQNMCNALATVQGIKHISWNEMQAIDHAHKSGEDAVLDGRSYFERDRRNPDKCTEFKTTTRGMTVRKFANGNAHVFFDKWALLDINRALAEFYGEVLPDAEDDDAQHKPSTEVSKDLQFYWTPPAVVSAALEFADIHEPDNRGWRTTPAPVYQVLEPSCGDGRILDGIKAREHNVLGIEFHAGRAAEARAKGHSVVTANFLEQPPVAEFDRVVMNPPFYGLHYVKHVRHALKFLRPGGALVAILPATARYDHAEIEGEWRDLPVASFAESGTNVPTAMVRIVRRAA